MSIAIKKELSALSRFEQGLGASWLGVSGERFPFATQWRPRKSFKAMGVICSVAEF